MYNTQPEQISFGSMVHVPFRKQRVENSSVGWYPSLHLKVMGSFLSDVGIMGITIPSWGTGREQPFQNNYTNE